MSGCGSFDAPVFWPEVLLDLLFFFWAPWSICDWSGGCNTLVRVLCLVLGLIDWLIHDWWRQILWMLLFVMVYDLFTIIHDWLMDWLMSIAPACFSICLFVLSVSLVGSVDALMTRYPIPLGFFLIGFDSLRFGLWSIPYRVLVGLPLTMVIALHIDLMSVYGCWNPSTAMAMAMDRCTAYVMDVTRVGPMACDYLLRYACSLVCCPCMWLFRADYIPPDRSVICIGADWWIASDHVLGS